MEETFCVYILYSEQYDKIYIGQTHDLINRIKGHNIFEKDSFTCKFRPWKVIYVEFFDSGIESTTTKTIKLRKGRKCIKQKTRTV